MDVLSQVEVEQELMRLSAMAEKALQELAKRARAAAEAEVKHKVARAKALLAAEGTVAEREARADVETEQLFLERRMAEALLLSAQEAGRTYRAQLEAIRSVNANLRPLVSERS